MLDAGFEPEVALEDVDDGSNAISAHDARCSAAPRQARNPDRSRQHAADKFDLPLERIAISFNHVAPDGHFGMAATVVAKFAAIWDV